ncbi:unnamed protein product [Rodentolepis nana]|uniref:Ovule protein n=1 Tax=Rodentolepis nana TaxID=102285 RepID=A0A0R3TZU3_RODNA|nr:unnamed protein product [Rodentolepis nana]
MFLLREVTRKMRRVKGVHCQRLKMKMMKDQMVAVIWMLLLREVTRKMRSSKDAIANHLKLPRYLFPIFASVLKSWILMEPNCQLTDVVLLEQLIIRVWLLNHGVEIRISNRGTH